MPSSYIRGIKGVTSFASISGGQQIDLAVLTRVSMWAAARKSKYDILLVDKWLSNVDQVLCHALHCISALTIQREGTSPTTQRSQAGCRSQPACLQSEAVGRNILIIVVGMPNAWCWQGRRRSTQGPQLWQRCCWSPLGRASMRG